MLRGNPRVPAIRRKLIARVHIAKSEMKLDDDSYRALIASVAPGKTSSAKLSLGELNNLVDAFKEKGWKPKPPKKKQGESMNGNDFRTKRTWLINKLWGELGDLSVLDNPTAEGLDAFCKKHMLGDKLAWASSAELNTIVDSLKGWLKRVKKEQAA